MADTETIGNAVVGTVLLILGIFVVAGTLGVAFIGELAAITLFILGAMMLRGSFGDHGTVAVLLMVSAPAAFILPAFVAGLWWLGPAVGTGVIILGMTKYPGVW